MVAGRPRTDVLLSSHLINEVETVADNRSDFHGGNWRLVERFAKLKHEERESSTVTMDDRARVFARTPPGEVLS